MALAALIVATLVGAAVPADAGAAATTVALQGIVAFGPGGVNDGSMSIGAACTSASTTTQPVIGAEQCNLHTNGSAQGSCTLWSGIATGELLKAWLGVGDVPDYNSIRLAVWVAGGVMQISGNATASDGTYRSVLGAAVLTQVPGWDSCSGSNSTQFTMFGSLTIAG